MVFVAVMLVCAEVTFEFSGLLTPEFSGPLVGLYVLFPPVCILVFLVLQTYVCIRVLRKKRALGLFFFSPFFRQ